MKFLLLPLLRQVYVPPPPRRFVCMSTDVNSLSLSKLLSGEEDPGSLFSILAALGMLASPSTIYHTNYRKSNEALLFFIQMYNDWDITDLVDKYGMCELVEKHVSSGEEKVAGCARDILLLIQWRRGG